MGKEASFMPDLTARMNNHKFYFEIVDYPKKNKDLIVTKWMLLSTLAKQRTGELFLMVPHGKLNLQTAL